MGNKDDSLEKKDDCNDLAVDLHCFLAGMEGTEAKHAELISRMTSQLRELNTLKQDAQRQVTELNRKIQVKKGKL